MADESGKSCLTLKADTCTPRCSPRFRLGIRRSPMVSSSFVSPLLKRPGSQVLKEQLQPSKKLKQDRTGEQLKDSTQIDTKDILDDSLVHNAMVKERSDIESQSCVSKVSCDKRTHGNDKEQFSASNLVNPVEKKKLQKMIAEMEETLRKLKMVKMYRKKNDLCKLQKLIDKWRSVSQEAAERLLSEINVEPRPSLGQLLHNLQISHELIQYSEEDESFQ